jgi:hypothetical protein
VKKKARERRKMKDYHKKYIGRVHDKKMMMMTMMIGDPHVRICRHIIVARGRENLCGERIVRERIASSFH